MNKEITVIPLGTVSPYCNNGKMCPGFLIKYNGYNILLDCGNGISNYLNVPNDLENLNIIISHLHMDHYGDLGSIAYSSYIYNKLGYLNERIKVYIPEGDITDFDYIIDFKNKENYLDIIPYKESLKIEVDDIKCSFSKNPHPINTYSIKLENDNYKLVYSGDTGFEKNTLESFAKDADLLICESTFLKGQIRKEDYHLFASEAGIIAKRANVKELLLTHFWPTIDKELYVNEAKEYFNNTSAALEGKKLILRKIKDL